MLALLPPEERPDQVSVSSQHCGADNSIPTYNLLRPDDIVMMHSITYDPPSKRLYAWINVIEYNEKVIRDQIGTTHVPDQKSDRLLVNFVHKNKFEEATCGFTNMQLDPSDSDTNKTGRFIMFTAAQVDPKLLDRFKPWVILWSRVVTWAEIQNLVSQEKSQLSPVEHIRRWSDYQKAALASEALISYYTTKRQRLDDRRMVILDQVPPMTVAIDMPLRTAERIDFKAKESMDIHIELTRRESDDPNEEQTGDSTFMAKGVVTKLELSKDVMTLIIQLSRGASHEALVQGLDDEPDNRYTVRPKADLGQHKPMLACLTGAASYYDRLTRNDDAKELKKIIDIFFGISTDKYGLMPLAEVDQAQVR